MKRFSVAFARVIRTGTAFLVARGGGARALEEAADLSDALSELADALAEEAE